MGTVTSYLIISLDQGLRVRKGHRVCENYLLKTSVVNPHLILINLDHKLANLS